MNYAETLEYMYRQLPMFQRVGSVAYKKDLGNTRLLCSYLGNPQEKLHCIHVAGTNGKGSVSHILAAILQKAGYKVGLYVSPHYRDFRERIKINGSYIPEDSVVDFIEGIKDKIEEINPSFFELTVAMAFDHFVKENCDYCVIETGLGGRLDSTNVITPLLSVITNISYDHMNMLGNSLQEIAAEKAGIIKENVPVVLGEDQSETNRIFAKKAIESSSILYPSEDVILLSEYNDSFSGSTFRISERQSGISWEGQSDISGPYQEKNLQTALAAAYVLKEVIPGLNRQVFQDALKNIKSTTSFIGRWMLIQNQPDVIFDSAHNEAGLKEVVRKISEKPYRQIHWVYGTVNDKDISKNLSLLPSSAIYYFCKPDIPRGLSEHDLFIQASAKNLTGISFPSVRSAYKSALAAAEPQDLVLVCGSIFVVAEVV